MSQESQEKPAGNTNNRWQLYCWCATIPFEKIELSQLSQLFGSIAKKFSFQVEMGSTDTKYKHYQCVFSLIHKEYFITVKNLLPNSSHIEPCKDFFASWNYCRKADTRVEGPIDHTNWKQYTVLNQFLLCEPKQWQKDILSIIHTKPCNRTIYWFWESKGGVGKTTFTKHLCLRYNALYLGGCSNDIKFAITQFLEKNVLEICVFDFARSLEKYISYEALESVKNGIFFSGKYTSNMVIYNVPHVICFANFPPNTSKLSEDRWKIIEII